MADNNLLDYAYHIDQPQTPVQMYKIDIAHAVGTFPKEWSTSPWTEEKVLDAKTAPDEAAPVEPKKTKG